MGLTCRLHANPAGRVAIGVFLGERATAFAWAADTFVKLVQMTVALPDLPIATSLGSHYLAEFWSQVFTNAKVHRDVTVRSGGSLTVVSRRENPWLRAAVNTALRRHMFTATLSET
jgi:hypothetical protein